MDVENNIIAPLIVAAITALVTALVTRSWTKQGFKKKLESAPSLYVQELDHLIRQGVDEGEANALLSARAIVKARNDLKGSLTAISKQLNSEIDRLAEEIGEAKSTFDTLESVIQTSEPDVRKIYLTIRVLNRAWPLKRAQIEVEIRKVLTELGLPVEATYQSTNNRDKDRERGIANNNKNNSNSDSNSGMDNRSNTQPKNQWPSNRPKNKGDNESGTDTGRPLLPP